MLAANAWEGTFVETLTGLTSQVGVETEAKALEGNLEVTLVKSGVPRKSQA